jgi:hypothetical protein
MHVFPDYLCICVLGITCIVCQVFFLCKKMGLNHDCDKVMGLICSKTIMPIFLWYTQLTHGYSVLTLDCR